MDEYTYTITIKFDQARAVLACSYSEQGGSILLCCRVTWVFSYFHPKTRERYLALAWYVADGGLPPSTPPHFKSASGLRQVILMLLGDPFFEKN